MSFTSDTTFRRHASTLATSGSLAAAFLTLIGLGTLLLNLPWARQPEQEVAWVDSLFVATSATCLTGLSTVNISQTYTLFGQAVILALIQLGGLGITTAGVLFFLVRRGSPSSSEDFIAANIGRLRQARPIDVFLYSCFVVVVVEMLGTVVLTYLLLDHPGIEGFRQAVWVATFHSVSAFCNAGFALPDNGLMAWRDDTPLLLVMCGLVVCGGIGLMTLVSFRYYAPWRRDRRNRGRLSLQTRLCLVVSTVLLGVGTVLTWVTEAGDTLAAESWPRAVLWAFVHSTMTRTAGFNVVDNGAMAPETLLGSTVLMFIGGSPGSMAGGIKVTTLVLLGAAAWSALRRRTNLVVGRHSVPGEQANNAVMVVLLSMTTVVLGIALLLHCEAGKPSSELPHRLLGLIYEAVSAFATVGLSTGVTPLLTTTGKLIIMALMFAGRLGPLCLAMHLAQPARPARILYPEEQVSVG